jgi:hypothetical protein
MFRIAFRAFGLAAAAVAGLISAPPSTAASPPRDLTFNVIRGGEPMGSHKVSFRQDGDKLIVEIAIDLEVRLAFIPIFRYTHRNTETWQDGRLLRLETVTNDDGARHQVLAEAVEGGLRVTDSSGSTYMAPADAIPTSYWHRETVRRSELLNTQNGKMMPVRIEARPEGESGADMAHYRLIKLEDGTPVDVWYDRQSQDWIKLAFEARGSKIEYELAVLGTPPQQAAK